jgi:hypothetical protein
MKQNMPHIRNIAIIGVLDFALDASALGGATGAPVFSCSDTTFHSADDTNPSASSCIVVDTHSVLRLAPRIPLDSRSAWCEWNAATGNICPGHTFAHDADKHGFAASHQAFSTQTNPQVKIDVLRPIGTPETFEYTMMLMGLGLMGMTMCRRIRKRL